MIFKAIKAIVAKEAGAKGIVPPLASSGVGDLCVSRGEGNRPAAHEQRGWRSLCEQGRRESSSCSRAAGLEISV